MHRPLVLFLTMLAIGAASRAETTEGQTAPTKAPDPVLASDETAELGETGMETTAGSIYNGIMLFPVTDSHEPNAKRCGVWQSAADGSGALVLSELACDGIATLQASGPFMADAGWNEPVSPGSFHMLAWDPDHAVAAMPGMMAGQTKLVSMIEKLAASIKLLNDNMATKRDLDTLRDELEQRLTSLPESERPDDER